MMSMFSPGTELKRFRHGVLPKVAVAVLLFIPLIYGALYLWAFWNPTGEMTNLPVALVNEDRGATRDGEALDLGDDVVAELVDSADLGWVETDAADAARGVADGSYYFSVTLPANFSKDAISVGTDGPRQASIDVEYNDANGFLATTMGKQGMTQLRDTVAEQVSAQTVDAMLVGLNEAGDGIRQAADGAGTLADGLQTASDGVGTLAASLGTLSSGASQVADGVGTLRTKYGAAVAGSGQVADGATQLADGMRAAASGASTLNTGLVDLAAGAAQVETGVREVTGLAGTLVEQAPTLANGTAGLAAGSSQLADGAGSVAAGASGVDAGLADLAAQIAAAPAGTPASDFLPALQGLSAGAHSVSTGAGSLSASSVTLRDNIATLNSSVQALVGQLANADPTKLAQLNDGAHAVADGVAKARDGSATLASSLGAGSGGAATLANGAGTLAGSLAAGSPDITRLDTGATAVADGAGKILTGAGTLGDGATRLATGADQLHTSLAEGGERIPSLTQTEIAGRADIAAAPIALEEANAAEAGGFGEGFAPFFIALATFVGALITWLILRPLPQRALAAGASGLRAVLTGFVPAVVIGVGQVVIMMLVLVYGIGLEPTHWVGTTLFMLLVTLAFMALQQMFIVLFGSAAGRVISLVLLMLQLSSSGGTYPVETTPGFFQALHPFMPASWVVDGLRQLITGGIDGRLLGSILVMAGILIGSLAVSSWSAARQRVWSMKRLYPELVI